VREVDYLIIGAGIAGMTLWDRLRDTDVALLDPTPGRYKIGESIVPQHFFPRQTRALLQRARRLPSASEKIGTLFVGRDSVSYFHAYFDAAFALHVDRSELEAMYRDALGVEPIRERVEAVDVERREVRTDAGAFRVRRQILDCSGPAMVLARQLGIAHELWPAHAAWAYWDVDATDDRRFWNKLTADGHAFHRYDDVSRCVAPAAIDLELQPSRMTTLTRAGDGTWVWQIPLRQAKLLSLGVVSRHAPVSREEYFRVARAALGAQYDARPRIDEVSAPAPRDGASPHDRFHVRNRFAWASRRFSDAGFALIGDAAFFGDPVYSVGTAIATNQALLVAKLLPHWAEGGQQLYERKTSALFARAARAYDHWYGGDVTADGEVAEEVQAGFLNGLAFHVRTGQRYLDMWQVAEPDDPNADPNAHGDRGRDLTELAAQLLSVEGWTLVSALLRDGALLLEYREASGEPLVVELALRGEVDRAYREVGPFALSYRVRQSGELGAGHEALIDWLARRISARQVDVLRLMERGDELPDA
jgi:flavin-dependent dehydrogenase